MNKKLLKYILYQLINPTFSWRPQEGLCALRRKMRLYFLLHQSEERRYEVELKNVYKRQINGDVYSWIFPYEFVKTIDWNTIDAYRDENLQMYYVLHKGKRLYFHKGVDSLDKVKIAYYCAIIEQNEKSPHCYLLDDFKIKKDGVFFDVGSAEGIIGLDNIENIGKLYLFEADPLWIPALKATFAPWKNKTVIVNKYVSDNNEGNNITLDKFLSENETVDFIKIDVEGAETFILRGAEQILHKTSKVAVCCYHKEGDEKALDLFLKEHNFKTSFSIGYMLFVQNKLIPPYFRKGLVRAIKK